MRVANYFVEMVAYHCHLWNMVLPALQAAPEELQALGLTCHQEAMALVRQERIATGHVVDTLSILIATSITLRRQAWLSVLSQDFRGYKVQDQRPAL